MNEPCTVALFCKAPVPGKVKTRLIPRLGPGGAAQLYARLLQQALDTALRAQIGPVELWCTAALDSQMATLAAEFGIAVRQQSDGGLGARMSGAFDAMLGSGRCAILVGSDCPARTPDDLREASAALLGGADVVLGPTEDGGYHLIGLRQRYPGLFADVPWSTERVLDETRKRVQRLGLRARDLPPRWDVDRPADLLRLKSDPALAHLVEGLDDSRCR